MRPCSTLQSLSNVGVFEYTQCGSLDIIPDLELHYNPYSIANLLSVSVVTSKYCVTMHIGVEDAIIVHLENNQEIKFTCFGHGLYYFDTTKFSPMETPHNKITDNDKIDKSKSSATG